MKTWNKWLSIFFLSAGLMAVSSALAASAWISVPSALDKPDKISITGGGLAPFSNVSLHIIQPDGTTNTQFATIAADGSLAVDYMPVAPGKYTVKVLDQNGRKVGSGDFINR